MSLSDGLASSLAWLKTPFDRRARDSDATLNLRRNMPLVPGDSIAGRALVTVIAIMTFLAALTAGAATFIEDASRGWSDAVSSEMTIQVRPADNRNLDADVEKAAVIARATPGIGNVRIYTKNESERLLEPWLGKGLDLGELPVPRLIVLSLGGKGLLDGFGLRNALAASVPTASLDDHRLWIARLSSMAHTLVAIALAILVLVLVAMALAVAFATRGTMAGNKEIVDVLHFVGGEDRFIAAEFQRHFLRLGLKGGLIGGGAAIVAFFLAGAIVTHFTSSPGGTEIEALFGTFSLGPRGYVSIALIGGGIAILTGLMSRAIVFRHLRGLA